MHLKHYEIVMDVDKLKVDLQSTFMKYKTIKQWAYIIHDKDDTRPHYHIYINFGSKTGVDSKLVAQWFKLGYTDENGVEHTGENFISKVKGRKADVLMYLTHENDSQRYKHIYERKEIHANFDVGLEIEQSKIIGDFEHYSYAQQLLYVETLPIDEKIKEFNKLKKLWESYTQSLKLNTDRNVSVVFITGKGGVGKTYYAKKMLTKMGLDFCVSSASNDLFQDYMGQKAIILDDLRDNVYKDGNGDGFEDLLKLLDNDTSSSIRSRFNNKIFVGDVIVVTSSVPIRYWYYMRRSNGVDSLTQLYRRIGTYIEITEKTISVYPEGLTDSGYPKGSPIQYVNELSTGVERKSTKIDFVSVFNNICAPAAPPATGRVPLQAKPVEDGELPF